MDFTLTEREQHFRDRVRDFIEAHIRPRNHEYHAQAASEPRWKVIPVIEELKPKAKAASTKAKAVSKQRSRVFDLIGSLVQLQAVDDELLHFSEDFLLCHVVPMFSRARNASRKEPLRRSALRLGMDVVLGHLHQIRLNYL